MKSVFALVLFLCAPAARAAGSVELSALRPLLHHQPALETLVYQTLTLGNDGWGVRLGNHFQHLGGMRIGPYDFKGKPAGAPGPDTIAVTICTQVTFVNTAGATTDVPQEATAVREEVTALLIRDVGAKGYMSCPK